MSRITPDIKARLEPLINGLGEMELRLFLDRGVDTLVSLSGVIAELLEDSKRLEDSPTGLDAAQALRMSALGLVAGFNDQQTPENPPLTEPGDIARFVELFPNQAPVILSHLINHHDTGLLGVFGEYCRAQRQLTDHSPVLDKIEHNYGRMKLLVEDMTGKLGVAA